MKAEKTNLLVAICALVVSICALVISIQEMRIMRKQQKAAMYPYLVAGRTYNSQGFGYRVKNSGNGLAIINSYRVYNDSTYFKGWLEVVQALAPEADSIHYNIIRTDGDIRNKIITPNEELQLVFFPWTPETRVLEKKFSNMKVDICYSSLLEEHWTLVEGLPVEIDRACKPDLTKEFGSR